MMQESPLEMTMTTDMIMKSITSSKSVRTNCSVNKCDNNQNITWLGNKYFGARYQTKQVFKFV